jgi:hypothetical protein
MIAKKNLVNNTYYLFDVSGVAEYDASVVLARLNKTSPERVGKLWWVPKALHVCVCVCVCVFVCGRKGEMAREAG